MVNDNCDAQIYFGVNSFATADLVSKSLGPWTMVIETANESDSGSTSYSSGSQQGSNVQTGWSRGSNYSEVARPLLNPAEILHLNGEYLIALIRGTPPILAKRVKYYSDSLFGNSGLLKSTLKALFWLLLVAVVGLAACRDWRLIQRTAKTWIERK